MPIPKVIYQTFKSNESISNQILYLAFPKENPKYAYEFYDDRRVDQFIKENFDSEIYDCYTRLQIGAAKADFFRYAILLKKGGIYLDLDSDIVRRLDDFIYEDDSAVICREKNHQNFFAQWALIFEESHPFLEKTIQYIIENIRENRYPHDVHAMTGPTVFSRAINDVLAHQNDVRYRIVADDYKGMMQFKYKFGKLLIYKDRKNHWKKLQKRIPVLKPIESL